MCISSDLIRQLPILLLLLSIESELIQFLDSKSRAYIDRAITSFKVSFEPP